MDDITKLLREDFEEVKRLIAYHERKLDELRRERLRIHAAIIRTARQEKVGGETMYKKYQKTALLEVISRDDDGNYIVRNEGDSSDVWTIPKATFESTYKEV